MTGTPTSLTNGSDLGFLAALAHHRGGLGSLDRAPQRDDRHLRRRINPNRQQRHPDTPAHVEAAAVLTKPPLLIAESAVVNGCPARNANLAAVRVPRQLYTDAGGCGDDLITVTYDVVRGAGALAAEGSWPFCLGERF